MKPESKAKSGEATNAETRATEKSGSDVSVSDEVTENRPGTSEVPPQSLHRQAEHAASEIDQDPELTDEEKLVLKLLQEQSPADLNELKGKTGLSNKKWDTAIKGLRAKELANVEKTDEGLFVRLV